MELFEQVVKIYQAKQYMNMENFSPILILVDGVFDSNFFSSQIRSFYSSNFTVTEIRNGLILLSLNSSNEPFNFLTKKKFNIYNYSSYSIFIKESEIHKIIKGFGQISSDLFYVCFENNSQIYNEKRAKNSIDFRQSKASENKFLYGFNHYSDLAAFYTEIIKDKANWPIFAFQPSKNIFNSSRKFINLSKSCFPQFNPLKSLYYLSLVEETAKKPKRMMNVDKLFGVKNIPDAQINHLYNGNDVRTFLGFDTKFRCLHVFDYFVHKKSKKENNSISDVKLISDFEIPIERIKYNLFYIEVQSFIDGSLMYSINNIESFVFNNNNNEFSSFYGFKNYDDFIDTKKLIKSFVNKNNDCIFKDIKLISNNEFHALFPNRKSNKNSVYIAFRPKIYNKNNIPNFSSLFNKSNMIINDIRCSLDNKLYTIVGFDDDTKRKEAFTLLKNSKYSSKIKTYKTEIDVKIKKKIDKKASLNENIYSQDEDNELLNNNENNQEQDLIQNQEKDQKEFNKDINIIQTKNSNKKQMDIGVNSLKSNSNDQNDFEVTKKEKNCVIQDSENIIEQYIESMSLFHTNIINFIEKEVYEEKDYKQLIQIVKDQKIKENPLKLKEVLFMVLKISNYHYKTSFFYDRIEKIILLFRDVIKKYFTNVGIFTFFDSNKKILLILIKLKLLVVDQQITKIMTEGKYKTLKYHFYFFPEIKQFMDETRKIKTEKKIKLLCNDNMSNFKNKRRVGENDDTICELIRKDSLIEFIEQFQSHQFDENIPFSPFETEVYLLDKNLTYIQYAVFCGSIKIFNHYIRTSRTFDPNLCIYAIHGNNLELIKKLEKFNIVKQFLLTNIMECVKCHHNKLVNYLKNMCVVPLNMTFIHDSAIESHNFEYLPKQIKTDLYLYFKSFCENNHVIIVDLLLNSQNKEIKKQIILISFYHV